MVLGATGELLDRYGAAPHAVRWRWASAAVDVVVRHGSPADARALLPAFLEDPPARDVLMPVLAQHGDPATAEALLAACVADGRLRDGMPASVLHAVGFLGYEPAERLLWEHVESGPPEACLGLLHLPCRDVRDEIEQALRQHLGNGLFPEFLPALAPKTGDPSWLGRLVEWGEGPASTDCNGGLILGIALFGARAEFVRLLWNPHWEAFGGGTGTEQWAYAGARVLGLTMPELYADLVARLTADGADQRHCIRTFVALLELWSSRPWLGVRAAPDPTETRNALCDLVFEWSTPDRDDSLTGHTRRAVGLEGWLLERVYAVESELRIRAAHEVELTTLTGKPQEATRHRSRRSGNRSKPADR
jgi:hypothetical protein